MRFWPGCCCETGTGTGDEEGCWPSGTEDPLLLSLVPTDKAVAAVRFTVGAVTLQRVLDYFGLTMPFPMALTVDSSLGAGVPFFKYQYNSNFTPFIPFPYATSGGQFNPTTGSNSFGTPDNPSDDFIHLACWVDPFFTTPSALGGTSRCQLHVQLLCQMTVAIGPTTGKAIFMLSTYKIGSTFLGAEYGFPAYYQLAPDPTLVYFNTVVNDGVETVGTSYPDEYTPLDSQLPLSFAFTPSGAVIAGTDAPPIEGTGSTIPSTLSATLSTYDSLGNADASAIDGGYTLTFDNGVWWGRRTGGVVPGTGCPDEHLENANVQISHDRNGHTIITIDTYNNTKPTVFARTVGEQYFVEQDDTFVDSPRYFRGRTAAASPVGGYMEVVITE